LDKISLQQTIKVTIELDIQGANYYDEYTKKLTTEFEKSKITVTKIDSTSCGDLGIMLSNNMIMEIFVNNGTDSECWRFFEPGNENSHFVITGHGKKMTHYDFSPYQTHP
jgi:hypothetical protein